MHGKNAKELELMVECGLTPTAVLQTATKIAAEAMGVEHDRGTCNESDHRHERTRTMH